MTRRPIREGAKVRVPGSRSPRVVVRLLSDVPGGVVLDKPVDGFRYWNVDELVRWRRR